MFLQASSSATEHEINEEQFGPVSPVHTKHHDCCDPKLEEEFPWLRYIPEEQDGLSMLCSIFKKHKKYSRGWSGLVPHVSFFAKTSFATMNDHNAMWMPLKLNLRLYHLGTLVEIIPAELCVFHISK